MFILNFVKKFFCKKKEFDYNQYKLSAIKEYELTSRENKDNKGKNDLISDTSSNGNSENQIPTEGTGRKKRQSRLPQDQFLCSECSLVPEILNISSKKSKISLYCSKHEDICITTTEYLDKLKDSTFFYLNNKCTKCNAKPQGMKTSMKYCLECNVPYCAKCTSYFHMSHLDYMVPIGDKNNVCKRHPDEKAEIYCLDCEEIICESDKSHRFHHKINTEIMQSEVDKYRKIIVERNKKLFSMIRFYRLVLSSKNEKAIQELKKSIEKRNKLDEDDCDLAIYYLKKRTN